MKKLLYLLGIYAIILSCSSDDCSPIPQFSSIKVEPINDKSINIKAEITPPSCEESFISQGIVYSTSTLPKITDLKFESSNGNLNKTFEGLNQNTIYYFRTFFENVNGIYYGDEVSSSTLVGEVKFSQTSHSSVTPISATVNFSIKNKGGGNISESGIVYSTSSNPTVEDIKRVSDSSSSSFDLVDLLPNSTYYYRAYAINEAGLFYSEEQSFTTSDGLVDLNVFFIEIKESGFDYSISIIDDGGYGNLITSRGVYFSASNNIQNSQKFTNTNGSINSLSASTGYFVFPYYTISNGEEYILDSIYVKTAPDNIRVEIRRFDQLLNSPTTSNYYGDYYDITGTDADVWIDTELKYISKATLSISENNFINNYWSSGWTFWSYGTIYSPLSQTKFEEDSGETLVRNIGKGGLSYSRIFVNDGDGKFDITYTIRVELTDHSGNTYYSDIIELDVPDFNIEN